MEREILLTGIGGQGVQLAARVLAEAAAAEGRAVQLFGAYSGMMRGGNTDATVVVGDTAIESPPTVAHAWSAIVMHDQFAPNTYAKLTGDGVVVVNSDVCSSRPSTTTTIEIAANTLADGAGSRLGASMVLLGAFASATGIVARASLEEAIRASLPPYRAKTAETNVAALRAGFAAVAPAVPAWEARAC